MPALMQQPHVVTLLLVTRTQSPSGQWEPSYPDAGTDIECLVQHYPVARRRLAEGEDAASIGRLFVSDESIALKLDDRIQINGQGGLSGLYYISNVATVSGVRGQFDHYEADLQEV